MFVGHQRPVAVSISGKHGIERQLVRPAGELGHGVRRNRLRIDRDELLGAAERKYGGAVVFEDRHQHVPGDGAVLVDANSFALERIRRKDAEVAIDEQPGRLRFMVLARAGLDAIGFRIACQLGSEARYRLLIRLVDLPVGPIELDPVAIGRDMRAGHHDAGSTNRCTVKCKCRCGDGAAVDGLQPDTLQGSHDCGCDFGAGRAKVPADDDGRPGLEASAGQHVARECRGIERGYGAYQVRGQSPQTARPELHRHACLLSVFKQNALYGPAVPWHQAEAECAYFVCLGKCHKAEM